MIEKIYKYFKFDYLVNTNKVIKFLKENDGNLGIIWIQFRLFSICGRKINVLCQKKNNKKEE